jgi:hypothetical protein
MTDKNQRDTKEEKRATQISTGNTEKDMVY